MEYFEEASELQPAEQELKLLGSLGLYCVNLSEETPTAEHEDEQWIIRSNN